MVALSGLGVRVDLVLQGRRPEGHRLLDDLLRPLVVLADADDHRPAGEMAFDMPSSGQRQQVPIDVRGRNLSSTLPGSARAPL